MINFFENVINEEAINNLSLEELKELSRILKPYDDVTIRTDTEARQNSNYNDYEQD